MRSYARLDSYSDEARKLNHFRDLKLFQEEKFISDVKMAFRKVGLDEKAFFYFANAGSADEFCDMSEINRFLQSCNAFTSSRKTIQMEGHIFVMQWIQKGKRFWRALRIEIF